MELQEQNLAVPFAEPYWDPNNGGMPLLELCKEMYLSGSSKGDTWTKELKQNPGGKPKTKWRSIRISRKDVSNFRHYCVSIRSGEVEKEAKNKSTTDKLHVCSRWVSSDVFSGTTTKAMIWPSHCIISRGAWCWIQTLRMYPWEWGPWECKDGKYELYWAKCLRYKKKIRKIRWCI